jgi:cytochrome b
MIWDRFVRLFHWSVAALFLLNFWVLEAGDPPHEWAGYAIAGLVVARIGWGFCGPANARFASFFPTPARLRDTLQNFSARCRDHRGHNPLGGLMILLLLAGLLLTAVSGWMQGLDAFWGEDWVENLHEWTADTLMVAVVVHISAVLIIQTRFRVPLIRAMIRGR